MKKGLLVFLMLLLSSAVFGQSISFLEFDGNDSYYISDSDNKLDVNDDDAWTLETWIYPTANTVPPSSGTSDEKYPAIISRKYSFEFYLRNTGSGTSHLGVGIVAFDGGGTGFTVEGSLNSGTSELALDEWNHVAVSFDGTTTRMFFDGTEIASSTDSDFDLDYALNINFGCRYDGDYIRYLNECSLDEIRYSKTGRYTANFSITKNSDEFTFDSNTILLYHLNENTSTSLDNDNDSDFDASLRSSPNTATWRVWDYYGEDGSYTDAKNLPLEPDPSPVELTSFSSISTDAGVVLNWETATEVNNYGFEVESKRASTGSATASTDEWETIGFVNGHGNSNSPNSYSFVDNSASGNTSYRLKQIDTDGGFEYSDVIEVNGVNLDKVIFAQNYPNPFNPSTTFSFSIPSKEFVTLAIYNSLGQKVADITNETMNAGTYNFNWNAADMTSGIYFARLNVGSKSQIQKIMLLK